LTWLTTADHGHDERIQYIVEAIEIGFQNTVPVFTRHGGKGMVAGNAGVADDAVIGTMKCHVLLQDVGALGTFTDIELQHPRAATHGADGLGDFVGGSAALMAMQHDLIAILCQTQGDGFANAAAGTGDQDGFFRGCGHAVFPSRNALASGG
jgi:hypothetical protein